MVKVDHQVEICLTRADGASQWECSSVRLDAAHDSYSVHFDGTRDPNVLFCEDLRDTLLHQLALVEGAGTFRDGNYSLTSPGLALRGLRLRVESQPEGATSASVRFERANGDLWTIFSEGFHLMQPGVPPLDGLALRAMEDLLKPALEVFDHVLENGFSEIHADTLQARLKTMRVRRDQLAEHIEVLKQVSKGAVDREGPREIKLDPEVGPLGTPKAQAVRWDPHHGWSRGLEQGVLFGHHREDEVLVDRAS